MKTLDEIGIFHQTDKASQFSRTYAKPHDYLRHMEHFFEPIRMAHLKFVEIGAAGGESIKMWLEYFEHSEIFGVDIVHDTNPYNSIGTCVHPRYTFEHGDQGDISFWARFIAHHGPRFDIVVDDGSHYANDVIVTFECLWPTIYPGGIYVIEDLGVAYGGAPFTRPDVQNHMDFIKNFLDRINRQETDVDRLHFSRELCILQKHHV